MLASLSAYPYADLCLAPRAALLLVDPERMLRS